MFMMLRFLSFKDMKQSFVKSADIYAPSVLMERKFWNCKIVFLFEITVNDAFNPWKSNNLFIQFLFIYFSGVVRAFSKLTLKATFFNFKFVDSETAMMFNRRLSKFFEFIIYITLLTKMHAIMANSAKGVAKLAEE